MDSQKAVPEIFGHSQILCQIQALFQIQPGDCIERSTGYYFSQSGHQHRQVIPLHGRQLNFVNISTASGDVSLQH